jgi:hypothetical protein
MIAGLYRRFDAALPRPPMLLANPTKGVVMKASLVILAALAAFAGATVAVAQTSAPTAKPEHVSFFGHIKAMKRTPKGYEIRFDPAWWLNGHAAEEAAFEDTGSRDVPNDYYVVDEGHRLLSFLVAKRAAITVLTRDLKPVRIAPAELNAIVHGKNPNHRSLFSPKAAWWIQIGNKYPNRAIILDQQYQP